MFRLVLSYFVAICILLYSSKVFGQKENNSQNKNNQNSNIDINYFRPKWSATDLKVTKFRNGVPLKIAKTKKEWIQFAKEPTCFIDTSSGNYFYNGYAVSDPNNIAPKGLKVPTISDFIFLKQNKVTFDFNNKTDLELFNPLLKKFPIYPSGQITEAGVWDASNNGNNQYFWTSSQNQSADFNPDDFEIGLAYLIKIDNSISERLESNNSGLTIRCIQNINEIIIDSVFSYKEIYPNGYKKLIDSLISILKVSVNSKIGKNILIKGDIAFSKFGDNVSREIIKINNQLSLNSLETQANDLIKNWKEYPFYEGIPISSSSPINISISNKESISQFDYYSDLSSYRNLNKLSDQLKSDLLSCTFRQFKCKKVMIEAKINDSLIKIISTKVKSVKGPGPAYSLYSIIPGLGTLKVDPKRKKNKGLKMWHFSLPIGLISVSSFASYTYYYSKYKNSDNFNINDYNKANISHKAFLTSSGIFAILAIADFTMSFNIGSKNKTLQRRVNKEILNNYPNGL
jgi:hypothetical protein